MAALSDRAAEATALAAIDMSAAEMRAYLRQCFISASGMSDPLYTDPRQFSRWHTDEGTLYLAEEEETVWAEACRVRAWQIAEADPTGGIGLADANFEFYGPRPLGPPVDLRALYEVTVEVGALADLTTTTSRRTLATVGIGDGDLLADDYGPCPDIAKLGQQLGWEAIRAPSAALVGGTCVAVLPGHHPPRERWRKLRDSARPIIAVAYLTRYRAGERPAWLGAAR